MLPGTCCFADRLPATAWQRHSAGTGAKAPRCYDWPWAHISTGGHHHPLVPDGLDASTTGCPVSCRTSRQAGRRTHRAPVWNLQVTIASITSR